MTPRRPFTGCGTALVTPFTANGRVDEAGVRRLARRQVEAGIHFLVPVGTTGEAPTLSAAEKRAVIEAVVDEVKGVVPVLAGAGGYNTAEVIEAAHAAADAGANGILSVSPYYNKPTQEGIYQHYAAIASNTNLPIVLYNVPGRTGSNIEPATTERLAQLPQIVGIKEASGNVFQMADVRRRVPKEFLVLSGDDTLTVPLMAIGGEGVISVASNEVPTDMARMVEACERGDFAAARLIHERLLPLLQANFLESNPGPVKAVMALAGLLDPVYRLPMVEPTSATLQTLRRIALDLGLLAETASA
ncbi:4-hydroxy-tetrahydrodipicolinate synthase [Luteitalea sp.]|jgi:4-hydroxy-tetrahydrodipicolinate synthase|uniref:4-hydroxy-tetrahydrodipicolinate synthase n=1 Tax=Luteitalea sp. TaxID=2004800 RepID=UPI0037C6BE4F